MTSTSTDYSYSTARDLRAPRLALSGNTYPNRDWIKTQGGTWDKTGKVWRIPTPGSTKATAELLYAIVSHGMQWAPTR